MINNYGQMYPKLFQLSDLFGFSGDEILDEIK